MYCNYFLHNFKVIFSCFFTFPLQTVYDHNLRENSEKMYYFTKLAIELNEPEEGVAPTDSRLRPDQRLMEDGKWNEANEMKVKIEEKQRAVRREREVLAEKALQRGTPIIAVSQIPNMMLFFVCV